MQRSRRRWRSDHARPRPLRCPPSAARRRAGESVPVTDAIGRELAAEAPPERVFCLADLLGRRPEAEAFLRDLCDRDEAYRRLAPDGGRVAVVTLFPETGEVPSPNSCGLFFEELGHCVTFGEGWTTTTTEGLLGGAPDLLLVDAGTVIGANRPDFGVWEQDPLWNELSAVRAGRVVAPPVDSLHDTSPLALRNMLDLMMPLLDPETFPDGPPTAP